MESNAQFSRRQNYYYKTSRQRILCRRLGLSELPCRSGKTFKLYRDLRRGDLQCSEDDLWDLADRSNDCFWNWKGRNLLQKKNTSMLLRSLEKLLIWVTLLPKIQKGLFIVPGGPVISNCERPAGKASEFLNQHCSLLWNQESPMLKILMTI